MWRWPPTARPGGDGDGCPIWCRPGSAPPRGPWRPDRYVLSLGTVETRKDVPALVRAFDRLVEDDDDQRLVIAGPDGCGADALATALAFSRHHDRIVRLDWVEDATRAALLRGASVFA